MLDHSLSLILFFHQRTEIPVVLLHWQVFLDVGRVDTINSFLF